MVLVTSKEHKSCASQEICHICKKKFEVQKADDKK